MDNWYFNEPPVVNQLAAFFLQVALAMVLFALGGALAAHGWHSERLHDMSMVVLGLALYLLFGTLIGIFLSAFVR